MKKISKDELERIRKNPNLAQLAQEAWEKNVKLLISDSYGIYIPQKYFEEFEKPQSVSDDDWQILSDPESEDYWSVWQSVLDATGLYQNGDLWDVSKVNEEFQSIADFFEIDTCDLWEQIQ